MWFPVESGPVRWAQAEQRICPSKANITFLILVKTLRGVAVGDVKRTLEKIPMEDTGRKDRGTYTSGTDHRSGVGYMLMLCELRNLRNWWTGRCLRSREARELIPIVQLEEQLTLWEILTHWTARTISVETVWCSVCLLCSFGAWVSSVQQALEFSHSVTVVVLGRVLRCKMATSSCLEVMSREQNSQLFRALRLHLKWSNSF